MTKQEEIDKVLILATGRTGADLDKVKQDLSALGLVIKVDSGWCPAHGYPLPCDKCGAPKGTWSVEPLISRKRRYCYVCEKN